MDRSQAKVARNEIFRLPRKGSSAVRITAPKTRSRQPAEPSPSGDLDRALSYDSQEADESRFRAGTTTGTSDLATSAPDRIQRQSQEGVSTANCKRLGLLEAPSTGEETAVPSSKTQLVMTTNRQRAHLREANSPQTPKYPVAIQETAIQLPKRGVALSTSATSQRSPSVLHTFADSSSSSLDVYAINYVPQFLRAINECPAQIRCSTGLRSINYAQYIGSFAGFSLLQPLVPFVCPSIGRGPLAELVTVPDLDQQNYGGYLCSRMIHELRAQTTELREYGLYSIPFDIADPVQGLYSFIIPGIRENSPRIDLGDTVLIRPWSCLPHEGLANLARVWYATNGPHGGRLAPGFSGWEYRAVVWGLQRSKERVVLRLDGFAPDTIRICNITFIVQDHKYSPLYSAIAKVARVLLQDLLPPQWLRSILFPIEDHGVLQSTLSKGSFDLPWYDKHLNFEQQKAVDAIVKGQYGVIPFIISGPPGTGKTKSLVEAALQLLHSAATANERCHLLICAPSDSAADTIATRLKAHLNHMELFRLNSWTRSFAEVPEHLMLHSYTENDLFAIPRFGTMMNFKAVVTTCRDAEMLVQARLTNTDLAVLTTQLSVIASTASPQPLRFHWSALLLDEAAQATEPEVLVPLTVVQPGAQPSEGFHSLPQFIMAGDEHQLGPKLSLGARSGLQYTLFQRLFERDIYANHPLSRKNGSQPLTAAMLPLVRPPFVNLVRNYRSHPAILTVPSTLFYHDTLMPEATKISDAVASWHGWTGALRLPVLFVQNDSPDSVESVLAGNGTGAGALLNAGEAALAEKLVKSLLSPNNSLPPTFPILQPHEVTVISPFRAQVNYLRKTFRAAGLAVVNIGPLEAFQGLESRVVVICTTRTRRDERDSGRFVKDDQTRGIGLIGDPKKFNVALTRAREGLIVIGDTKCLTSTGDKAWTAFIAFCERNGCVQHAGKKWTSVSSDVLPGRMEKALRYAAKSKAQDAEKRAAPVGFGYATLPNSVLRGHLPTSDEAMWADGMRLAEENEMSEADEEERGQTEDADYNIAETPARTTPLTMTANASDQLISIPPGPGVNGNDASKLISFSPEAERNVSKGKENMPTAEETVFDRDLETEITKEECEMQ